MEKGSTLNEPFFREGEEAFARALLDAVKVGVIRGFDEIGEYRMPLNTLLKNLQKVENIQGEYFLMVGERLKKNDSTQAWKSSSIESYTQLYYQPASAKSAIFVISFANLELKENILVNNSMYAWVSPFDFTDQRLYTDVFEKRLFSGKIIKYIYETEQVTYKVSSQSDWRNSQPEWAESMPYEISYNAEKAIESHQGTLHYPADCDSIYFTDIRYKITDMAFIVNIWEEAKKATRAGYIRPYLNDSLMQRMSYNEFEKKGLKLESVELELKVSVFYLKDQKMLFSFPPGYKGTYGTTCGSDVFFHNSNREMTLNIYKKEAETPIISYSLPELFKNLDGGIGDINMDEELEQIRNGEVSIIAVSYIDPVTGKLCTFNKKRDLELLKSRMPKGDKSLKKKVILKGELSELR